MVSSTNNWKKNVPRDEGGIYSVKEMWETQNPVKILRSNKLFKRGKKKEKNDKTIGNLNIDWRIFDIE